MTEIGVAHEARQRTAHDRAGWSKEPLSGRPKGISDPALDGTAKLFPRATEVA